MTKIEVRSIKCAVCGKESEQRIVLSTNTIGTMDLDTRPAPQARYTIDCEVQECPYCHYCNSNIGIAVPGIKTLSKDYRILVESRETVSEVKKFILAAALQRESGNALMAGIYYLNAAWISDDREDSCVARKYRKTAAENLLKYLENNCDAAIGAMTVDVLRRAGKFDAAYSLLIQINHKGDKIIDAVLAYQCKLISAKDETCHKLSEIILK